MRGTLTAEQWLDMHRGIIPAYAGNTMRCSARYYDSRDHPRVCGEHIPIGWKLALALGSSPRMRGTPAGEASEESGRGIIPAYAGNTIA